MRLGRTPDQPDPPSSLVISGGSHRWFVTKHALQRMREMAVGRTELIATLEDPEIDYPARDDRRISQRGQLAVCWIGDIVITVLWRSAEDYERIASRG